jgi:hypothetical protein
VESDDDFTGHIAYSLYKSQKLNYIKDFVAKNGREPLEDELESFHTYTSSNESIAGFRSRADEIFRDIFSQIFQKGVENAYETAFQEQKNILTTIVEPMKPDSKTKSFFKNVGYGIVSNFAFIFVLVLLSLLIKSFNSGIDVRDLILEFFRKG